MGFPIFGGLGGGGGGGSGAPTDATYLTKTPNSTLSAEIALSTLSGPALIYYAADGTPRAAVEGVDFNVPITSQAIALNRARALLGNTVGTPLGAEFENNAFYTSAPVFAGTTGTNAVSQTLSGGVVNMTTGATSAHGQMITPAGNPAYVGAGKTERWYARFRWQGTTAVTAQTRLMVGLFDPTSPHTMAKCIRFGLKGNSSTTKIAWDIVGAVGDSGTTTVDYDNAFHTLEIVSDGTTITFYYDGAVVGTSTTTKMDVQALEPGAFVYNGTDNVAYTHNLDSMWVVCVPN